MLHLYSPKTLDTQVNALQRKAWEPTKRLRPFDVSEEIDQVMSRQEYEAQMDALNVARELYNQSKHTLDGRKPASR